jgi:hypothetical protein
MPRNQDTREHAPSTLVERDSDADLVSRAAALPLGPAYISASHRERRDDAPPLVVVVITRLVPDGTVLGCVAAVDRTCLGVRSAAVFEAMPREELEEVLLDLLADEQPFESCSAAFAQSVLYHGVDYARSLGFEPHPSFVEPLYGPRPERLLDTPYACAARPLYVAGPCDTIGEVVEQLERRVGAGNFGLAAVAHA